MSTYIAPGTDRVTRFDHRSSGRVISDWIPAMSAAGQCTVVPLKSIAVLTRRMHLPITNTSRVEVSSDLPHIIVVIRWYRFI